MEIYNFDQSESIYNNFLAELRDVEIQKDSMRFRRNLERCGEISAYEISKEMNKIAKEVNTPLGISAIKIVQEIPVVAAVLRAGLPLHQGVLNYFDSADNCFISAYRKHTDDINFDVEVEYLACPSVDGRIVILCDPMLATGKSMYLAYQALLTKGTPKFVHIVSVIASQQGIDFTKENFPENTKIWIGAIDEEMTVQSYILPGLGDAGDLAFGKKLDE